MATRRTRLRGIHLLSLPLIMVLATTLPMRAVGWVSMSSFGAFQGMKSTPSSLALRSSTFCRCRLPVGPLGRNRSFHPTVHPQVSRRQASTVVWANGKEWNIPDYVDSHDFLRQVEASVDRVLSKYDPQTDILDLPPNERESLGIARNLDERIQAFRRNNDCPRCWMQRAHCICSDCPPLEESDWPINRVFVLMHHKEICLTVDTAKIIFAAFPKSARLVVGGISPEYQPSMQELVDALSENSCFVLFPSEDAETFETLSFRDENAETRFNLDNGKKMDLIIIDGTWEQARRLYKRYIPSTADEGPRRVQLTGQALSTLSTPVGESGAFTGRQLRRHPELYREISTLAAMRLLLLDMDAAWNPTLTRSWDILAEYQERADTAAIRQLGVPRLSSKIAVKVSQN
jgi:DTW domain-containing protein YfiP